MKNFVDVILPLPLGNLFTYSVPDEWAGRVKIGCRVVVSFGKKKYYSAIVCSIHAREPDYEVKEITSLLDHEPVVLSVQLEFWQWIAEYYLCTPGEVYKAALPSGMKLESETLVEINPEFEALETLPEKAQTVLDLLSVQPVQTITRLARDSGIAAILPVIKFLLERDALYIKEEIRGAYKPHYEIYVTLGSEYKEEETVKLLFDRLKRASRQLLVLMKYMELSGWKKGKEKVPVTKRELLRQSGVSGTVLSELVKKNILVLYQVETVRNQYNEEKASPVNPLNNSQLIALEELNKCMEHRNICLLHGVTSSGKTEVYIHLIQEALHSGKQVLYLLPEIALTTQITTRLKRVFGSRLGIYHSKFPDAERVELWKKQLSDEPYQVILGVRSSIFLPFTSLGLVIVDEEHESSYKQFDPAPRYHARNAAIVLASFYNAKVVLGTATPSIESYYNALKGKYGLVELKERYQDIRLPEIVPVDIKELTRKRRMSGWFSPYLIGKIKEALEQKEQVILFQNRRGFAPMIECNLCGWVPKCKNCDVSLTYHKGMNQLTCHYCGYTYTYPRECPVCKEHDFLNRGFGTEKVEDDIKAIFPNAKVARMDLDTTRTRTAYEKIITGFEEGKTDIMIGTQMVSKGLDFERVSVVGILNADTLMNYPDFRSIERAYQLMAQVSGRAGRKNRQGLVVLQTKSSDHPVIEQVINNNYLQMYREQLEERRLFRYPPFYRLIYIYLKSRNPSQVDQMANDMACRLTRVLGDRVLGPDIPPVGRIQTLYIKKIVLKIEAGMAVNKIKDVLLQIKSTMLSEPVYKSMIVYFDVDPM